MDIVERRGGSVPNGMSVEQFLERFKMDECFRAVTEPLLDEVYNEAKADPDKQHLESIDFLVKMIDDHIVVNCAAMEQNSRIQKKLLGEEGVKEINDKAVRDGDTPEIGTPGVNHMKHLIAKHKADHIKK